MLLAVITSNDRAFYTVEATVLPILVLALTLQGEFFHLFLDWLDSKQPKSGSPNFARVFLLGVVFLFTLASEGSALTELAFGVGPTGCKMAVLVASFVLLFGLLIAGIMRLSAKINIEITDQEHDAGESDR